MKPGIHPVYGPVAFRDKAAGFAFLSRSTARSEQTVEWEDGRTYPVVDVEVSSASHPFYTPATRGSWTPPAGWSGSTGATRANIRQTLDGNQKTAVRFRRAHT